MGKDPEVTLDSIGQTHKNIKTTQHDFHLNNLLLLS